MSETSTTYETSLAARQFLALARGEMAIHAPRNEFVTVAVEREERFCRRCYAERVWDVWHGRHDGLAFALGRCRACGTERTL